MNSTSTSFKFPHTLPNDLKIPSKVHKDLPLRNVSLNIRFGPSNTDPLNVEVTIFLKRTDLPFTFDLAKQSSPSIFDEEGLIGYLVKTHFPMFTAKTFKQTLFNIVDFFATNVILSGNYIYALPSKEYDSDDNIYTNNGTMYYTYDHIPVLKLSTQNFYSILKKVVGSKKKLNETDKFILYRHAEIYNTMKHLANPLLWTKNKYLNRRGLLFLKRILKLNREDYEYWLLHPTHTDRKGHLERESSDFDLTYVFKSNSVDGDYPKKVPKDLMIPSDIIFLFPVEEIILTLIPTKYSPYIRFDLTVSVRDTLRGKYYGPIVNLDIINNEFIVDYTAGSAEDNKYKQTSTTFTVNEMSYSKAEANKTMHKLARFLIENMVHDKNYIFLTEDPLNIVEKKGERYIVFPELPVRRLGIATKEFYEILSKMFHGQKLTKYDEETIYKHLEIYDYINDLDNGKGKYMTKYHTLNEAGFKKLEHIMRLSDEDYDNVMESSE